MLYLIASCIALLLGPVFYRYFSSGSGLHKGLDGFIFVSLGGLVLIHILPELLQHGGLTAILFVILGLWGPTASEKLFHQYSEVTHNLTLGLGVTGLLLHTLTDGGAMVLAQQEGNSSLLALGIILHRLPVGVAIWWLLKPQVGTRWASIVLTGMIILTSIGYFAGDQLVNQLSLDNTVYLQAFVTGSILHVVLHQPHVDHHQVKDDKYEYEAGVGSLLGLGLLFILLLMDSGGHDHAHHHEPGSEQLIHWMLTIAPALLLSYLLACARFKFGLSPNVKNLKSLWVQRLLGPEALVISFILLGPSYALLQLVFALLMGGYFIFCNIEPVDPHKDLPNSPWQFGLAHLVDRSAPWILLSLILASLIGHPSMPLSNPWAQVVVLLFVFLPMRFCNLGASVLALSLAFSGWSPIAVLLPLVAAPWFNLAQCKMMSWKQKGLLVGLLFILLTLASQLLGAWESLLHLPYTLQVICLTIITLLFAASLLRLGPRKFLSRLFVFKLNKHHHSH